MIDAVPAYVNPFDESLGITKVGDLPSLLWAEFKLSMHVDPVDVAVTIDVMVIAGNLFLLDQMNPPTEAYDYPIPKDWQAAAKAARAAAAEADYTKDDAFDTYMGRWTRMAVKGLEAAMNALAIEHPEQPGGEV